MNKFRRFALLFASLALASCGPTPSTPGVDGYKFGKETFLRTDMKLRVVLLPNQAELRKIGPPKEGLMAFAKLYPDGSCTIYMVDARSKYEPEWLGHELTHCIYGEWHK